MQRKMSAQIGLDYQPGTLKETAKHFAMYEEISRILDRCPAILDGVHADIEKCLDWVNRQRRSNFTSDQLLRFVVAQVIEGETLRGITIRIDDSNQLRRFTRIYNAPMMSYSHLCELRGRIEPETWVSINLLLTRFAIEQDLIRGKSLRLDTTAVETNIHWPTDSSLLWDSYRVLCRLLVEARKMGLPFVLNRRFQERRAKKLHRDIARMAGKGRNQKERLKRPYTSLIQLIEGILGTARQALPHLADTQWLATLDLLGAAKAQAIALEIEQYLPRVERVVDQARRRVLEGESVPADEKIYSIFEDHTELIKRGKAGKPIEFGHMVLLEQVDDKFITGYDVFKKRPADSDLVDPALKKHVELFGKHPEVISGDKGFYESMEKISSLEKDITVVGIPKKGRRNETENERESTPAFRAAQRFRAGIEGTISYIKRAFGLFRSMTKGWAHYAASVGCAIFAHNLVNLARRST